MPLIFLACAGTLMGCATAGNPPVVDAHTANVLAKIKTGVMAACGFEVALPVLTQIVNAAQPTAIPLTQLATGLISAICQQVSAVPAPPPSSPASWLITSAYAQAAPTVNGVVVQGRCKVPSRGCKR